MQKSRIKKYHHENNYCELDGKECIHCRKCDHIRSAKKSNFLLKFLLVLLIILICYLLMCHIKPAGIEKRNHLTKEQNNNSMTLDDKVVNYNMNMPNNERAFREWSGIGNESIGDNYNSIGSP